MYLEMYMATWIITTSHIMNVNARVSELDCIKKRY